MRALTVRPPWAWAITDGGKDVENRSVAWAYRGQLAIHAGAQLSERGVDSPLIHRAVAASLHGLNSRTRYDARGAIIGVCLLTGSHLAEPGCCESEWAEQSYTEARGRVRRQVSHLILEHVRALADPVPCRGAQSLWFPPANVLEQLGA